MNDQARQQFSAETGGLLLRVATFLGWEAKLMDSHRYDDWFDLWTDDVEYWVPANPQDTRSPLTVSIINDDRERLNERLMRWKGGYAHAQIPRPDLVRVVSFPLILPASTRERVVVESQFHLTLARPGGAGPERAQDWVTSGRSIHHLVPDEDGFKIATKHVRLLNAHYPMSNLQFLV